MTIEPKPIPPMPELPASLHKPGDRLYYHINALESWGRAAQAEISSLASRLEAAQAREREAIERTGQRCDQIREALGLVRCLAWDLVVDACVKAASDRDRFQALAGELAEALRDLTFLTFGPCQRGLVDRCVCPKCYYDRRDALLAAHRERKGVE